MKEDNKGLKHKEMHSVRFRSAAQKERKACAHNSPFLLSNYKEKPKTSYQNTTILVPTTWAAGFGVLVAVRIIIKVLKVHPEKGVV